MDRLVLRKYWVGYFRCEFCGSAQTEAPYWIGEAYDARGTGPDTGACQRSVDLALQTAGLLSLLCWHKDAVSLDFGAGMGLFARMMRDRGFNFYAYDEFASPFYMDQFTVDDPKSITPALITAHEVLEHLPNPSIGLAAIFDRGANLVIVTTEEFKNQAADWWYLAPERGQHVFFYSERALNMIAARFGYKYGTTPRMHVYWRPEFEAGGGNINEVLEVANDPRRFSRVIFEGFVMHQRDPYRYAKLDMERFTT